MRYIKISEAEKKFPGYKNYPSIHYSGSLIGMRDIYGWDLKKVIRVGSYYYHLRGHPNI